MVLQKDDHNFGVVCLHLLWVLLFPFFGGGVFDGFARDKCLSPNRGITPCLHYSCLCFHQKWHLRIHDSLIKLIVIDLTVTAIILTSVTSFFFLSCFLTIRESVCKLEEGSMLQLPQLYIILSRCQNVTSHVLLHWYLPIPLSMFHHSSSEIYTGKAST